MFEHTENQSRSTIGTAQPVNTRLVYRAAFARAWVSGSCVRCTSTEYCIGRQRFNESTNQTSRERSCTNRPCSQQARIFLRVCSECTSRGCIMRPCTLRRLPCTIRIPRKVAECLASPRTYGSFFAAHYSSRQPVGSVKFVPRHSARSDLNESHSGRGSEDRLPDAGSRSRLAATRRFANEMRVRHTRL